MEKASRTGIIGDGDPLDVCVLAEKSITHGDILLPVTPIGGLRMIDGDEADDKIIAVMQGDAIYGHMKDIHECPPTLRQKKDPRPFGQEAHEVIERSMADYVERYPEIEGLFRSLS